MRGGAPVLQTKRYLGPVQDGLAVEEFDDAGLDDRRPIVRDHDGGDDGVAVIVESNCQCRLSGAKGTGDRVRTTAALHPRHSDRVARPQNRRLVAHQVEVAQAIELVVIGNAGRAIEEVDLGPDIKVDLGAAVGRRASERFALAPFIHREGPWHLGPNRMAGRCHGPAAVRQRSGSGKPKTASAPASPTSPKATTAARTVVLFIASAAAIVCAVCPSCLRRTQATRTN